MSTLLRKLVSGLFTALALCLAVLPSLGGATGHTRIMLPPAPSPIPAVISVTVIPLARAVSVLRELYPHARIEADRSSNAVIVLAPPETVQAMRTVIQGIDVRNPTTPTIEIVTLHVVKPSNIISRLQSLYPGARIARASATSIFVKAVPIDMTEIKALIGSLDTQPPAVIPSSNPAEAVHILQMSPRTAARAVASQFPHVKASVSGSSVIIVGTADDIAKAKSLIASIDQPAFGMRYTQIYRLKNIDAGSVGDLVTRSYPNVRVTLDKELNAISIFATAAEHQRIGDAINQLDGAAVPGQAGGAAAASSAAYGSGNVDVIELKSAIPAQGQGQNSTTVSDIGTAVSNSLQSIAPDLKITPVQNSNTLILSGSPQSIRLAHELIDRLDRTPPLVVLDTEILELDENVARNIGLSLGQATISSSFQEITPQNDTNGFPRRLIGLQPVGRTPITFTAVLNLLVQKGTARVLADPRITTLSGKMASIRAGDSISILTQTAGGPGTPITQQVQTLQTGVTLDITPIVNSDNGITVWLHPSVNSISPVVAGIIPTISTRDTQTVVHLKDNQTLVIGGLIQEAQSKSMQKIPLLGDLPLVGRVFRSDDVNYTRNELIMVVTPHILLPGAEPPPPGSAVLSDIPTPRPLPTLPPSAALPTPLPQTVLTPPPYVAPSSAPIAVASNVPSGSGARYITPSASPTPQPVRTPSAFASANVFEYGSAPQNAFANDTDPPQIFYASYGPTIVKQGTPVTVSAITTTNVKRVTIGVPGFTTSLSQIAPSKWQASYPFSTAGLFSSVTPMILTLTAYRFDGAASAIQVPVSVITNSP